VAVYNVDETLTPVLLTAMHTNLFYVSFAGFGLGLGLGIGLLVTAGFDYNTV